MHGPLGCLFIISFKLTSKTSSKIRVTVFLWGESTGGRWVPVTRSNAENLFTWRHRSHDSICAKLLQMLKCINHRREQVLNVRVIFILTHICYLVGIALTLYFDPSAIMQWPVQRVVTGITMWRTRVSIYDDILHTHTCINTHVSCDHCFFSDRKPVISYNISANFFEYRSVAYWALSIYVHEW